MSENAFQAVDAFLSTETDARAIQSALDLGIIEALEQGGEMSLAALAGRRPISPVGLRLLADLLAANGVIGRAGDLLALTARFRTALAYRDLLECRIAFADLAAADLHTLFTPLLTDVPQFIARSRVFDLFRYDRCFDVRPANLDAAAAWTKLTTCLTKYEADACLSAVDLGSVASVMDLGGNTGEFALQLCRRQAQAVVTVVDLPVVCALGRRHVAASADASVRRRVTFFACDMRSQPLPAPANLVTFKSVLHDWPDADAERLLERAHAAVKPGGRLLIFERGPLDLRGRRIPYALLPDLIFLHFLRPADLYLRKLAQLGFVSIEHRTIDLHLGFHLIVARRPL